MVLWRGEAEFARPGNTRLDASSYSDVTMPQAFYNSGSRGSCQYAETNLSTAKHELPAKFATPESM